MEDSKTIYELAAKTQLNMIEEATAVKGYTEQGELIAQIAEEHPEMTDACKRWEAMNDELIADELNHQEMLRILYEEITGIEAAKK